MYSFGIVLLEIVIGRNASNQSGNLVQWISKKMDEGKISEEVLDAKLNGIIETQEVRTALLCLKENPDLRPSMSRVVELLSQKTKNGRDAAITDDKSITLNSVSPILIKVQ
ncbi:hypothetical protein SUGI_0009010 [Cryptomeria japonica]|nr:hypothetical protein SUGI_0009010 [Cryptomeria japonica]